VSDLATDLGLHLLTADTLGTPWSFHAALNAPMAAGNDG
jgi:hypothetical protein